MTWSEVCEDPSLQDLPYKIELNEYGQILMSPASNDHGWKQMDIGIMLSSRIPNGRVVSECSIQTRLGVKVADVAWISDEFIQAHRRATPYPVAPELCVEIISPSNSRAEMTIKRALYFEHGAQEVWICDSDGNVTFYSPLGELAASALFPDFPARI